MKKVILSTICAFGMSYSFGQNLETVAKQAAIDAGCMENGAYEYQVSTLGGCASGPAETSVWSEVLILPKVNAHIAPYVKLAPIARVTLCGNSVLTVECLLD
ncbi:MAG: hypothetical protein QE487_17470 [Fluviicola sp.]|nr:hypothetical protein [Fluviicola sp.]